MSTIIAKANNVRIAPRKLRLLANLIARKEVEAAEHQLTAYAKRGSSVLIKLLRSAKANASHNAKLPAGTPLIIKEIRVNAGRMLKRFMPRAFGRASPIRKRTSHVTVVLTPKKLQAKS
ncbi:MAG: 50S ribosomal protein L22 [Patescibacteria group bacterium]|jgi:large subunit ribosomal protein L22